ncbi:hypothetical protein [Staphylococcus saprophyticus]|nr:hypothetical protein [Staphylococcus saprophyticus]
MVPFKNKNQVPEQRYSYYFDKEKRLSTIYAESRFTIISMTDCLY